jgi:hypothetical protein
VGLDAVSWGAALLFVAATLTACNPYVDAEALPAARCRTQRDCRPGDHCREERCEAVRSLVVIASPHEVPVRGWVLATRDGVIDPLADPSVRYVDALSVAPGARTADVAGLPDLCLWLLAWVGGDLPEDGDASAVVRVPDGLRSRVALAPTRPLADAPRRPPPLGWADRAFLLGD